jgi:F-type H+-transporting ATPase subunit epsilon
LWLQLYQVYQLRGHPRKTNPKLKRGSGKMALTVRVVAPDKTVWDADAEEVILPSTTGQLGILPGHAPLLSALDIGVMRVRTGKDWQPIAVMGGFAEIENNEVTVLVNGAESAANIDKEAARAAYSEAEANLNRLRGGSDRSDVIQAERDFKRARARYQATGGMV